MHAEAIARTGSWRRRNCREHKVRLSSRIFRLERTFSLRLHARRPIFSTNQLKGNPMVPKAKDRNRIVASPLVQAPTTLREVHDHDPDPRLQSSLRRLQRCLSIPLESMPADIDWFDARFPKCGCNGAEAPWTSARAYNRWRTSPPRHPSESLRPRHLERPGQPASSAPPVRHQGALQLPDPGNPDSRACRERARQGSLREFPQARTRP